MEGKVSVTYSIAIFSSLGDSAFAVYFGGEMISAFVVSGDTVDISTGVDEAVKKLRL